MRVLRQLRPATTTISAASAFFLCSRRGDSQWRLPCRRRPLRSVLGLPPTARSCTRLFLVSQPIRRPPPPPSCPCSPSVVGCDYKILCCRPRAALSGHQSGHQCHPVARRLRLHLLQRHPRQPCSLRPRPHQPVPRCAPLPKLNHSLRTKISPPSNNGEYGWRVSTHVQGHACTCV